MYNLQASWEEILRAVVVCLSDHHCSHCLAAVLSAHHWIPQTSLWCPVWVLTVSSECSLYTWSVWGTQKTQWGHIWRSTPHWESTVRSVQVSSSQIKCPVFCWAQLCSLHLLSDTVWSTRKWGHWHIKEPGIDITPCSVWHKQWWY